MPSLIVRTLSHELHLRTNSPDVHAKLMFMNTEPMMPGRELTQVGLDIEPVGALFRICPPGLPAAEGSLETVAQAAYRLIATWWSEEINGAPVVHAATAVIDGCRVAFVGDKRAGKTTLMLRLIQERCPVQGDENLIVTEDGAVPTPRCLHIKEPSLDVLPALSEKIRSLPFVTDWIGNIVYSCPPSFAGGDWTIVEGPVDALVFLEPNFGGSSVLTPLDHERAFERLLENAFLPPTGRARAVARLRNLVIGRGCWRLQTGNLDQAIDRLRRLAARGYGCASAQRG